MRSGILVFTIGIVALACSPAKVIQESKFEGTGEVVCRDVVPVGSHLKERVCTTVAASKEDSDRARRVLEEAQQRRAQDAILQRGGRRSEGP